MSFSFQAGALEVICTPEHLGTPLSYSTPSRHTLFQLSQNLLIDGISLLEVVCFLSLFGTGKITYTSVRIIVA